MRVVTSAAALTPVALPEEPAASKPLADAVVEQDEAAPVKRSSRSSSTPSPFAMVPQSWHPGSGGGDQEQPLEYADEATYQQKWRRRRLAELLQHPDLHPGLVNELLAPDYLERQRHVLAPDEAFGAIFQLDVITDVAAGLLQPVWARIAAEYKKKPPTVAECQRALGMLPEMAVMREFRWTTDFAEAKRLTLAFAMELQQEAAKASAAAASATSGLAMSSAPSSDASGSGVAYTAQALPGVQSWLARLQVAGIPCAAVSRLPGSIVTAALEQSGLAQYFSAQVAAEDAFERDLQGFLKATLKIGRPPAKCAVFDCRPAGMIQAHEAEFKGVATVGLHPVYELGVADLLASSLGELHVQNVRRLFSDREYEPELELQREPERKVQRRPVMTRTREEVLAEAQVDTTSAASLEAARRRRLRRR